MDFQQMQDRARTVRAQYADVEASSYGRSWTTEEIMLGFLGDVGDLAKLVQGKAGVRPREDLD
ncbi:MAG TPA: nucleotide pyrophosphohydrolase, partial [Nocardioides sp.]|nr:nucleotide pyrophosphohydrolase [Nocardioides sp.]